METIVGCPRVPPIALAKRGAGLVVLLAALATGCASVPRPPSDLELRRTEIVVDLAAPELAVDGHSGRGSAAAKGAAKGAGTGAAVGTVACLGAGPMAPLCWAMLIPGGAAVGAVSWSVAAAATTESADAVALKRELLQSDLPTSSYPALLAANLRAAALDRFAIELPMAGPVGLADRPAAAAVAHEWRIELALSEVACEDNRPGQPYALRIEGRLRLYRADRSESLYEKSLAVRSDAAFSTAQWRADGAAAARSSMDQSLRRLAQDLLNDLVAPSR